MYRKKCVMTKLLKSVLSLSVAAIVSGLFPMSALAGTAFDEKFADKTLRVDYIFSGDAAEQSVSLCRMSSSEGWYGRRGNLDGMPLRGNGEVVMTDAETGKQL